MTDPAAPSLWPALLAAQRAIEPVDKDGQMTGAGNYKFAKTEDVIREARERLHAQELILTFSETSSEIRETQKVDSATGQVVPGATVATVHLRGKLVHAPTGEADEFDVSGESADYGDKAMQKAYTNAVKYGLRHLLLIPFGDDGDPARPAERGTSSTARGSHLATDGQRKMLFAKSKDAGLNPGQLKSVLKYACGVESIDEVPKGSVDKVVEAIGKAKAQLERAAQPTREQPTPEPVPAGAPQDGPPLGADGSDIPF